jgi:hypothetical protein
MNAMKKNNFLIKFFFPLGMIAALLFAGCKDDAEEDSAASYDPDKPVVVTDFFPKVGNIREKVVIQGSNFGNDASKVKVFFEDGVNSREATVIGVKGEAIYCITPRQNPGDITIKVVIDEREFLCEGLFTYNVAEKVTTIMRAASSANNPPPGLEGPLSNVTADYMDGIAYIGNQSVMVFTTYQSGSVRLVSVPDNQVVLLHSGMLLGKPAVTKDLTKVYAITKSEPHTIYQYAKESGWMPSRLGELGKLIDQTENFIGSLTFADDEDWLYFCSSKGVFGRYHVTERRKEIINDQMDIPTSYTNMPSPYINFERQSFLVYDPFRQYFLLSISSAASIYTVTKTGEAAWLVGIPSRASISDGYLSEASFAMPHGMTLDDDGNIYVCDGSRGAGQCIRKITPGGFVSTVAGKIASGLPADTAMTDGVDPLQAVLRYPNDICYDGEGGFWFVEGWGRRLRKYAIE